jgi:fructose-bisphosphate aldolase, class I
MTSPSTEFARRMHAVVPSDRKVLIIPMDHGLVMCNLAGLQRPASLLDALIDARADGTLMSAGMAKLLGGRAKDAGMSLTMMVDHQIWGDRPGAVESIRSVTTIVPVAMAASLGADAVKALFVTGLGDSIAAANVGVAARLAAEAYEVGMPLMLEPLWFGETLPPDDHDEVIVHAARMALELGADILKIPAVGADALSQILAWGVPTVFLGGAKQADPSALFNAIRAGLAAGASGVVVGRNVWQRPDLSAAIEQLRALL